jgi:predicted nuclease of predicted toxin-antitoxin system
MRHLKFLPDENVEKPLVDSLAGDGYDILWLPDHKRALIDVDILTLANSEKRILITNDKDFGELIFLQKKLSTGIILMRMRGQETARKITVFKKLLQTHHDKLMGSFVIITDKKVRIIPLEVSRD